MLTALTDLGTRLFRRGDRSTTIIVGVNAFTQLIARNLELANERVNVFELEDVHTDQHYKSSLTAAGVADARCVIGATANDAYNLDLCRISRFKFGVPTVVTRLRLLDHVTSWAKLNDLGMIRLDWREMISTVMPEIILGQALARVASAHHREQVVDIKLVNPSILRMKIKDLTLHSCEALALKRDNVWIESFQNAELRLRDVITLIGTRQALNKVRGSLTTL